MARHLHAARGRLVFTARRTRPDLVESGLEWAATPRELAERCDAILVMLPDLPQLEEALAGPDGILAGAGDLLLMIGSTSSPPGVRALAARLDTEQRRTDPRRGLPRLRRRGRRQGRDAGDHARRRGRRCGPRRARAGTVRHAGAPRSARSGRGREGVQPDDRRRDRPRSRRGLCARTALWTRSGPTLHPPRRRLCGLQPAGQPTRQVRRRRRLSLGRRSLHAEGSRLRRRYLRRAPAPPPPSCPPCARHSKSSSPTAMATATSPSPGASSRSGPDKSPTSQYAESDPALLGGS